MAVCKQCENCIHKVVCIGMKDKPCHNFKDKADFVEVKHGEWITDGDITECSNCHKEYITASGMLQLKVFGYCPYCGAKMDRGKDYE